MELSPYDIKYFVARALIWTCVLVKGSAAAAKLLWNRPRRFPELAAGNFSSRKHVAQTLQDSTRVNDQSGCAQISPETAGGMNDRAA